MAKKRKRAADDDDDFDDIPHLGRPRDPEQYGPPKPQPHECEIYARRLQAILDAIEIPDLAKDVRLYLQFLLRRCDRLRSFDPKRFPSIGEEVVTLLLRTVFESSNGQAALTLPILRAVNGCMRPVWVEKGLALIEAYDSIELVKLYDILSGLGLADQFERVLRRQLTGILGPALVAQPMPKPKRIRKPTTKPEKPDGVSQEVWDTIMAQRRERRRKQGRECYRRRKAREDKKVRKRAA